MNDDEQTKEVFAQFGLALYLAQVLEHGLVNAMIISELLPDKENFTKQNVDDFMNQQFEKTLGTLIKKLKRSIPIPDNLEKTLSSALRERNWLAHNFFRERHIEFINTEGRKTMLEELRGSQKIFEEADNLLTKVVMPLSEKHGITEELYEQELEKMRKEHQKTP